MAEHTTNETSSWHLFVDQVAASLRLESPERVKFGLLATLTIVRHAWGDIVFLRAAERLVAEHAFALDELFDAPDRPDLHVWFAQWLTTCAPGRAEDAPHVSQIVKPAWTHPSRGNEAQR